MLCEHHLAQLLAAEVDWPPWFSGGEVQVVLGEDVTAMPDESAAEELVVVERGVV